MSGVHPTPCSAKSVNDVTKHQDRLQLYVEEHWKREIKYRINVSRDTGNEFLRKFVPASVPYPLPVDFNDLASVFDKWNPIAGEEKKSYPVLVKGLQSLVSSFPPNKRLTFVEAHRWKQRFPFSAFASNHNKSFPDLAVTFPGFSWNPETTPKLNWTHFSMILEAKATPQDDPFEKDGLGHCKTLVQLAINARCLLHAHGLLATFVVGIYGDIIRIARFDHSCAVVSGRLFLKRASHLNLVQRFFWHFVNPNEPGHFVGWDPTVRRLTPPDIEWLKTRLDKVRFKEEIVMSEARRVELLDDEDLAPSVEPPAYILFKVLDVNGRLFSRATTVWLGIRDTRRWDNGLLVDDPSPDDLKVRVVKEAWRQLARRPERDCYARLALIPPADRVGLPRLMCGGDLGEREVQQWEAALSQTATFDAPDEASKHRSRLSLSNPDLEAQPVHTGSIPPSLAAQSSPVASPLHRPMQQTFSWRRVRGNRFWHRERSHMRFVTDTVGRSLTRFRCTKELVTAVRDAIKGHRTALTKAGVLHRDISVGNILIVDQPADPNSFAGFLHDFDYSSMSRDVPDDSCASLSAAALAKKLIAEADMGSLKERTGTYFFMAVSRLNDSGDAHWVHHDLESFYWVLVWVVVRHVAHGHPLGPKLCSNVFPQGTDEVGGNGKVSWLQGKGKGKHFVIPGNPPLTDLVRKLSVIVGDHFMKEDLDYDMFLAPFEEALARDDWPVGDEALPFVVPDLRTNTVGWPEPSTTDMLRSRNKQHPGTNAAGSKRKASALQGIPEEFGESELGSRSSD
ncbi:hypothetical protein C8T65DRAFT_588766 [Cerioporus squamosus]|nr:hypothetical protein C8T65DRAFT_588766 [Cerioporus squamosus]